ncbi:unnamed protein product [Coregonus sp. 'balchen']|nr:unnamed protein product [Coregonus sp. 'balchen']
MFSVKPLKPTFKSYLLPVQTDLKKTPQPPIKKLEARLLPGEIVVNEVSFVRKCIGADSSHDDLWGKLICTNFKRFQVANRLLGEHDVPLACVEQVVTVNDAKGKQKVLGSNQKLKFNPTELILYCKDFRIIRFRFDEAGPQSAKKVCLAIAHYSHPADPQLLFGFEYVGKQYYGSLGERVNGGDPGGGLQIPLFDRPSEWDREIKRTGAAEWRVCSINEGYVVSPSLPEYFVVPLWCWNHPNGSALVRMASISDPLQQRKLDQRICSAITKSHPQRSDVLKSDLDKNLPNIQDIQAAFPFEESEEKWLSAFLKHSAEVVYLLEGKHVSVILQEEEDRDLSCVVSSLVQLMLDPHFRSLAGFQSLVQKEWVMAGHRFLDRCNHLKKNDKEEIINQYPAAFEFTETYLTVLSDSMWIPVFSTFLFNCPQQRTENSMDFAKSKCIPLGKETALRFPPVWDWSQQFTPKDQALFNNPMYVGKGATCVQNGAVKSFRRTKKNYSSTLRGMPSSLRNILMDGHDSLTLTRRNSLVLRLKPDFSQIREVVESPTERFFKDWFSRPADLQGMLIPQLLAFTPGPVEALLPALARIPKGGPVTAYHKLSQLADEIEMLQSQLRQYKGATPASTPTSTPSAPPSDHSRMYFKAGSTHEPSSTPEYLSSSFPFSPVGNMCRRSILGTPLSKFLNGAKIWLSTETLASEPL